jgi:hypothetical protein
LIENLNIFALYIHEFLQNIGFTDQSNRTIEKYFPNWLKKKKNFLVKTIAIFCKTENQLSMNLRSIISPWYEEIFPQLP